MLIYFWLMLALAAGLLLWLLRALRRMDNEARPPVRHSVHQGRVQQALLKVRPAPPTPEPDPAPLPEEPTVQAPNEAGFREEIPESVEDTNEIRRQMLIQALLLSEVMEPRSKTMP